MNTGATVRISGLTIFGGLGTPDSSGRRCGGGIYNSGSLAVTACVIRSNNTASSGATGVGAGIYNAGNLSIEKSSLFSNFSSNGGGVYNDGTMVATNSTFAANNTNTGSGAAIYKQRHARSHQRHGHGEFFRPSQYI